MPTPPRGKIFIDGRDASAGPPPSQDTSQKQTALSLLVEGEHAKEVQVSSSWTEPDTTRESSLKGVAPPSPFLDQDRTLTDAERGVPTLGEPTVKKVGGNSPPPSGVDLFFESWFESSPWGMFTPEKAPRVANHPEHKGAILAGKVLGKLADVGAWALLGYGAGEVVSSSARGLEVAGKLGGSSKGAQALRGVLKGAFIGGEAGKAIVMHEEGYTPEEIAIEVGGDVASFKGFEYGLKKAVEPKLTEQAILKKAHEQSQHIVYAGRERDILHRTPDEIEYYLGEKPKSIGFAMKGTGEEGWKPTAYSAKTKGVSTSAIDKQRGWLIEEGVDTPKGGRVSWIGRVKKFMTSAEAEISNYNPEKPFVVEDLPAIRGGGRSVQVDKEILMPREVPAPASSLAGNAKLALIKAIKSVEPVRIPETGLGVVTLLKEIERNNGKKKPTPAPVFERWEEEKSLHPSSQSRQEIRAQDELQEDRVAPYWELDPDIVQLKEKVRRQKRGQDEVQVSEVQVRAPIPAPTLPESWQEVTEIERVEEGEKERQKTIEVPKLPPVLLAQFRPPKPRSVRFKGGTAPMHFPHPRPSRGKRVRKKLEAWERELQWGDIDLGFNEDALFGTKRKKEKDTGRKRAKKKRGRR